MLTHRPAGIILASGLLALCSISRSEAAPPGPAVWQCWVQAEDGPIFYEMHRYLDRDGRDAGTWGYWSLNLHGDKHGLNLESNFRAHRGAPPISQASVQILWSPVKPAKADKWKLLVKRGGSGGGSSQSFPVKLEPGGFTAEVPLAAFGIGPRGNSFSELGLIDGAGRTVARTRVDATMIAKALATSHRAFAAVERKARRFRQECGAPMIAVPAT